MNLFAPTYARLRASDGQTMTEYAVLMALLFLVILVGVLIFGGAVGNLWQRLGSTLPGN